MKTVIICLICLTGIFTFVELHDSSKNEQQLNIRSVSDRKSSVNPITLDQTKLKNEMPEDIVEHTIQTTSKVSSNKKKSKTNVSINLIAEQEILSSPSPENLGPFETELLKNEITSDQLSVNNTVNSINLTDKEPVIQTEGIKVLSAKIEKIETEGRLFSEDQQIEKLKFKNLPPTFSQKNKQFIDISLKFKTKVAALRSFILEEVPKESKISGALRSEFDLEDCV